MHTISGVVGKEPRARFDPKNLIVSATDSIFFYPNCDFHKAFNLETVFGYLFIHDIANSIRNNVKSAILQIGQNCQNGQIGSLIELGGEIFLHGSDIVFCINYTNETEPYYFHARN